MSTRYPLFTRADFGNSIIHVNDSPAPEYFLLSHITPKRADVDTNIKINDLFN